MDQPIAAIIVGGMSATVTACGWLVLNFLNKRKDMESRIAAEQRADKLRRIEINLQQIDRRISELYGPIHNQLHHIWVIWEIKHHRMKPALEPETFSKVEHHLESKHFSELHDRIRTILREKAHLVEGGRIPESFYAYMKHSIMQNIQIDLWDNKQIGTIEAKGYPYSNEFVKDINDGLMSDLRRRKEILDELQSNSTNSVS